MTGSTIVILPFRLEAVADSPVGDIDAPADINKGVIKTDNDRLLAVQRGLILANFPGPPNGVTSNIPMEESLATFDLKAYARRGAEARVTELNAELESIFTAFPDLRSSTRGRTSTRGRRAGRKVVVNHEEQATGSGAAEAKLIKVEETGRVGRRRRKMTAAERKAVGERMRKYWAARKKAAR